MFAFGVQNAAAFNFDATSNPKLPTTDEKTKINIPTEKHDIDTLKDQVSGLKFVLKTTRTERDRLLIESNETVSELEKTIQAGQWLYEDREAKTIELLSLMRVTRELIPANLDAAKELIAEMEQSSGSIPAAIVFQSTQDGVKNGNNLDDLSSLLNQDLESADNNMSATDFEDPPADKAPPGLEDTIRDLEDEVENWKAKANRFERQLEERNKDIERNEEQTQDFVDKLELEEKKVAAVKEDLKKVNEQLTKYEEHIDDIQEKLVAAENALEEKEILLKQNRDGYTDMKGRWEEAKRVSDLYQRAEARTSEGSRAIIAQRDAALEAIKLEKEKTDAANKQLDENAHFETDLYAHQKLLEQALAQIERMKESTAKFDRRPEAYVAPANVPELNPRLGEEIKSDKGSGIESASTDSSASRQSEAVDNFESETGSEDTISADEQEEVEDESKDGDDDTIDGCKVIFCDPLPVPAKLVEIPVLAAPQPAQPAGPAAPPGGPTGPEPTAQTLIEYRAGPDVIHEIPVSSFWLNTERDIIFYIIIFYNTFVADWIPYFIQEVRGTAPINSNPIPIPPPQRDPAEGNGGVNNPDLEDDAPEDPAPANPGQDDTVDMPQAQSSVAIAARGTSNDAAPVEGKSVKAGVDPARDSEALKALLEGAETLPSAPPKTSGAAKVDLANLIGPLTPDEDKSQREFIPFGSSPKPAGNPEDATNVSTPSSPATNGSASDPAPGTGSGGSGPNPPSTTGDNATPSDPPNNNGNGGGNGSPSPPPPGEHGDSGDASPSGSPHNSGSGAGGAPQGPLGVLSAAPQAPGWWEVRRPASGLCWTLLSMLVHLGVYYICYEAVMCFYELEMWQQANELSRSSLFKILNFRNPTTGIFHYILSDNWATAIDKALLWTITTLGSIEIQTYPMPG